MRRQHGVGHTEMSLDDYERSAEGDTVTPLSMAEDILLRQLPIANDGSGNDDSAALLEYSLNHQTEGDLFPLVILHLVRWAERYFAPGGDLGTALYYRFCFDEQARDERLDAVARFSQTLNALHGQVCRQLLGQTEPQAHATSSASETHHYITRKTSFMQRWQGEYEPFVALPLRAALERIDCPILRALVAQPSLHLSYFLPAQRLKFNDLGSVQERLARAGQLFDLTAGCSRQQLTRTLSWYGHM